MTPVCRPALDVIVQCKPALDTALFGIGGNGVMPSRRGKLHHPTLPDSPYYSRAQRRWQLLYGKLVAQYAYPTRR